MSATENGFNCFDAATSLDLTSVVVRSYLSGVEPGGVHVDDDDDVISVFDGTINSSTRRC